MPSFISEKERVVDNNTQQERFSYSSAIAFSANCEWGTLNSIMQIRWLKGNDKRVYIVGMNGPLSLPALIYRWHFQLEEFLVTCPVLSRSDDARPSLWNLSKRSICSPRVGTIAVSHASIQISVCQVVHVNRTCIYNKGESVLRKSAEIGTFRNSSRICLFSFYFSQRWTTTLRSWQHFENVHQANECEKWCFKHQYISHSFESVVNRSFQTDWKCKYCHKENLNTIIFATFSFILRLSFVLQYFNN